MSGLRRQDCDVIPEGLSKEIMSLHRRVVALLTGLLLLQSILVGSGFACTSDETGDGSAMATMDNMAAMSMGSPNRGEPDAPEASGATPEQPCGAPSRSEDCGGASSSEACTAMTSCAPTALAAPLTALAQPSPAGQGAPRGHLIQPSARPAAPDHPPPRA